MQNQLFCTKQPLRGLGLRRASLVTVQMALASQSPAGCASNDIPWASAENRNKNLPQVVVFWCPTAGNAR